MKLVRNAKYALANPSVVEPYLKYCTSKLMNFGSAVRNMPGGVSLTGFSNFGEYNGCEVAVSNDELEFMQQYPLADGSIVDVGANLGLVSLLFAKRFSDRQIYSFEPNPTTYQSLKGNINFNKCFNITPEPYAVCAHDGEVTFNANPVSRATTSIVTVQGANTTSVPATKLDSFAKAKGIEQIAFLKVDVEGYETLVFKGAEELLKNQRVRVVYYELCPRLTQQAGFDPLEPTRMLQSFGYQIHKLGTEGMLEKVDTSDIAEISPLTNWIGVAE